MYCEITDLQQWDPTSYWVRLKKLQDPKGLLAQLSPVYPSEYIEKDCYTLYSPDSLYIGMKIWTYSNKKLDMKSLEKCLEQICFSSQK